MPDRHKKVLIFALYIALGAAFLYFVLPRLLVIFLPFIIAYILAKMIEPLVHMLEGRFRIHRKVGSIIGLLIATGIIGLMISTLVMRIYDEIRGLIVNFPFIKANFIEYATFFINSGPGKSLPASMKDTIMDILGNMNGYIWTFMSPFTDNSFGIAKRVLSSVPSTLIFVIVTLFSTYLISSDNRNIYKGILSVMPEGFGEKMSRTKNTLTFALGAYLKAQLILMSLTFIQMCIWFLCLHVNYALAMAFITAIVDALPFLGTGTLLIPWAAFCFVTGNYSMGVALLIAYGVAFTIRQFLEPKLVSVQIGLHPLITIMSIYVGLTTFGFFGVVLGPVVAIIIVDIIKTSREARDANIDSK